MSLQPECETAIDDIINEIIVDTGRSDLITLNLANLGVGEKVKNQINVERRPRQIEGECEQSSEQNVSRYKVRFKQAVCRFM